MKKTNEKINYNDYYKYLKNLDNPYNNYKLIENYVDTPIIISKDVNKACAKCFFVTSLSVFKRIYFKETSKIKNYYEVSIKTYLKKNQNLKII